MVNTQDKQNAREAAYLAVAAFYRKETFIAETLDRWNQQYSPIHVDLHFARQIAQGTVQRSASLDFLAGKLSEKKELDFPPSERALLHTAIYQYVFMDRVPLYALVNESVEIAKKYCYPNFFRYLNAILRKLPERNIPLPEGEGIDEISIRYSYPTFFVSELIREYGKEQASEILESGNTPSLTMVRFLPKKEEATKKEVMKELELIATQPYQMAIIRESGCISDIASSPDYYIQNITPILLMDHLRQNGSVPKRVLDLCAAPGGKLLLAHDFYPEATLVANDVTPQKLRLLKQNCAKYGIEATLKCSDGSAFKEKIPFDLIILDVPCSNSGVLNKRPEARWRLTEEKLNELEKRQLSLIENSVSQLSPQGEIWYLTCSILKRENEGIIEKACKLFNLEIRTQITQLPNLQGYDGGFACALHKKS